MSNNLRFYGTAKEDMFTEDLHVGQTLISADWREHYWDETEWTVKSVLKSRVVLTRPGRAGDVVARVLVDNSKWTTRPGRVQNRLEGGSDWDRGFNLFTPEDAILHELRRDKKASISKNERRIAARNAADDWTRYTTDISLAKKAVEFLQAYIDFAESND